MSRLTTRVGLRGHLENPAPTLERALNAYQKAELTPVSPDVRPPEPLITQPRLTADQVGKLVTSYAAGASMEALATEFGVHRTTVSGHLRSEGVDIREQALPHDQADRAVELYQSGLSLARTGHEVGCNAETVRSVLKRRGIPRRGPHDPRPRA